MIPSVASNLKLVRSRWEHASKNLDVRAVAMRDEMAASLLQLAKEEIKGKRGYTTETGSRGRDSSGRFTSGGSNRRWDKATSGQPPMNRTGDLRRSIKAYRYRIGFASYGALVGPTIKYGRAVELGGKYGPPTWRNGEHFPYMQPAYKKFQSVVVPQLVQKYFGKGGRTL